MICPKCNTDNPEGTKFCGNCGNPLPMRTMDPPTTGNQLPIIGAILGLATGLLSLLGWFGAWTSAGFGNGPQFVILPFGLGKASDILQNASGIGNLFSMGALSGLTGELQNLMGIVIVVSVLIAAASICLAYLIVVTLWAGVQCLEARGDERMLGTVVAKFGKFRNYGLFGLAISLVLMVCIALVGATAIGGGLYTMAFGFPVEFLAVVYLKPRLHS